MLFLYFGTCCSLWLVASPSCRCLTRLTVSRGNYSDILASASDTAKPDLLIELLRVCPTTTRKKKTKNFARCRTICACELTHVLFFSCSVAPRERPPTVCHGGPLFFSFFFPLPIRFHSGIFTLDKQRRDSVCPRSTSLPLLTKLQRADWNPRHPQPTHLFLTPSWAIH